MVAIPFKLLSGRSFMVEVDPSFTILQVKKQIEANHGVAVAKQTMIFAGQRLKDDATIVDLGIVSETAVMFIIPNESELRLGGGGAPAAASVEAESKTAAPAVAATVATPVKATAIPTAKAASAGAPPPPVAAGAGTGSLYPDLSSTAAAPAPAAASANVSLNVKELNGHMQVVNVSLSTPFREIKSQLARLTGIPVDQQRLVFRGRLVDENQTPAFYNCTNDTCMHLVRHVTRDALADVITEGNLRANCMFCHKAGAQFEPRALCAKCNSEGKNAEAVMITDGEITFGTTKWRDLLGIKLQCFGCGNAGPAAIGFLCKETQSDGHNCVSRRERRLQNSYTAAGGEDELQATMNRHFGYAHAGGMQDTI